jgi:hypothetical protein
MGGGIWLFNTPGGRKIDWSINGECKRRGREGGREGGGEVLLLTPAVKLMAAAKSPWRE